MSDFKKKLQLNATVKDYAANVVKRLQTLGKPFIQFGAGVTGSNVIDYLQQYGLKPICFCDNNPLKVNTILKGINVRSLNFILQHYQEIPFVISCDAFNEISRQLKGKGIGEDYILYIEPSWIKYPTGQSQYIEEHIDDFEEVYEMLCDQKSKSVFLGLLNFKITNNLQFLEGLTDIVPYFDEEIIKNDNEVFLDCGAYIGDTLLDFVKYTKGKYKQVACFEPNLENVSLLKKKITENKINNVQVFPYALSDKKQQLMFEGDSENGKIVKNGTSRILCDTIDNLCFDMYRKVDLIKMDIEGSEYYALKGAEKLIKRDHPKLAICVYHRQDDFFILTKLIKMLYEGYQLYFRQYELSGDETVCIAIPR